jgi:hypothetical protein
MQMISTGQVDMASNSQQPVIMQTLLALAIALSFAVHAENWFMDAKNTRIEYDLDSIYKVGPQSSVNYRSVKSQVLGKIVIDCNAFTYDYFVPGREYKLSHNVTINPDDEFAASADKACK